MRKLVIIAASATFIVAGSLVFAQNINLKSLQKAVTTVSSSVKGGSLSNEEVANGLKNALTVGATNASGKLNKQDGFFRDAAVKILLPPEAQSIARNVAIIPGGQRLMDDFVFKMNRAAEDAASTAKPIFVNAITSMTIMDAINILYGSDDAATSYLRNTSSAPLKQAFMPKIAAALDKKIVGNVSASQSWAALMNANNKAAKSVAGQIAGMKTVNANLSEYVTDRAIAGMFIKIGDEEKLIRKNPVARVNDVLKKVFGQLDKK